MGKGVALQFKRAFPDNYKAYRAACEAGEVQLGRMFVTGGRLVNPRLIVNFPTKGHWKSRSRLQDIDAGLKDLRRVVEDNDVKSLAMPPLGCGRLVEQRPESAMPGRIDIVIDRAQAVASVAGSLRLEGLEPTGPVRELADLWVRGDASDADLREAERRLLAGEPLEGLLASVAANGASRHV